MKFKRALLVFAGFSATQLTMAQPPSVDRVLVPAGSTWSLANFEGARESSNGRKVVFQELFFNDNEENRADLEARIANFVAGNHLVVCSIPLGSITLNDTDINSFPDEAIASGVSGFVNTLYINITNFKVVEGALIARIEEAAQIGCHAILPRFMDCMQSNCVNSDNDVTLMDSQTEFTNFIVTSAQNSGLAVGVYDLLSMTSDLANTYDFVYSQQCANPGGFNDCVQLQTFSNQGKAVFILGDIAQGNEVCNQSKILGFGAKVEDVVNEFIDDCVPPQDVLVPTTTINGLSLSVGEITTDVSADDGFNWLSNTLAVVLVFVGFMIISGAVVALVLYIKSKRRQGRIEKREMEQLFYGLGHTSARSSIRSLPMPSVRGAITGNESRTKIINTSISRA
eukprot:CFRG7204T1